MVTSSKLNLAELAAAINAAIQEIAVTDDAMARRLKFPGSPTIRVNGRNVDVNPQSSYGLACRLYSNGTGVPTLEALRRAIAGAGEEKDLRNGIN
jgi:hypothetical protein